MKSSLLVGSFVAALSTASPTFAQQIDGVRSEVRIGLIDTKIRSQFDSGVAKIYSRSFVTGEGNEAVSKVSDGLTHGELMAKVMIEAAYIAAPEADVKIFAANPIKEDEDGSLRLDRKGLLESLEWLKKNDVKIIATTFVIGKMTPSLQAFVDRAKDLDIIVVASLGNTLAKEPVYPAASPDVFAVAGDYNGSPINTLGIGADRADAVFDGTTSEKGWGNSMSTTSSSAMNRMPGGRDKKNVHGSSFAVARAAAILSLAVNRDMSLNDVRRMVDLSGSRFETGARKSYGLVSVAITSDTVLRMLSFSTHSGEQVFSELKTSLDGKNVADNSINPNVENFIKRISNVRY